MLEMGTRTSFRAFYLHPHARVKFTSMFKPFACSLFLIFVAYLFARGQETGHSAVLGDLRVTLTAVRDATEDDLQQFKLRPQLGYHFVLVFLEVKNVANYQNCSRYEYWKYWLGVRKGYQYPGRILGGFIGRKIAHLPPAEDAEGGFYFEVKNGTEPATLKILRDKELDDACAHGQHREHPISGPTVVRFSLHGLPAKSE